MYPLLRSVAVALMLLLPDWAFAQSTPPSRQSASQDSTASAAEESSQAQRQLQMLTKPWVTDFDGMFERRAIRVVAPYSRTLYFNDKGRNRGLAAELVRDFENHLNKKYKKKLGHRPITIVLVPATRDQLLPNVVNGFADLAVGNLTVTEERLKIVDMIAPYPRGVREILVTGPSSPAVASIDTLSGKTVHVRRASSYYESLLALNARFKDESKPEAKLVLVPDALEDEDMMEMLNVGLLQAIVVDDWKAKMWSQILPKVVVHDDIVLRDGGRVGWAIRQGSPQFAAEINSFYTSWVKKQGVIPYRLQQYMKRIKHLKDPTGSADWQRFQETVKLFEKYGGKYAFDPLLLTAQGYQESQLDQKARSHVGAIGVMQLMPATGAEMKVGDIKNVESNIHAGAKYMDHLMARYFSDANFTENNRTLFAFASYNAGPGNIAKARKRAKERGLDPDQWFNNVEIVVAERIGAETTTYVRNVYKYYIAYKLIGEAHRQAEQARTQVVPAGK